MAAGQPAPLTGRAAVPAPPAVPGPRDAAGSPPTAPAGGPWAGRPDRHEGDLGSIYGAGSDGPGFATVAFPANPLETSGSLTGHILAQGWTETPAEERSSNARVVLVLAVSVGLLVAISVLVVLLANDAMDGLVGDILSR
ncbi:hypothetical protein GKC29_02725 [Micromonospora sp. WMMC415]|nr:hypothetical protein GKC29_02725 [Micromonospora sp. WMMC415]